ncbi:MAG: hypothetical protein ACOZB0_07250 [Pseudomonadota bacterium]
MNTRQIIISTLLAGMASLSVGAASADQGYLYIGFNDPDYRHWRGGPDRSHDRHYEDRYHQNWGMWRIDRLQAEQRDRIREGWRDGELTQRELSRLRAEQREIERLQRVYAADGLLTASERRRLLAELSDANRNITREIHDREDRDRGQPREHHGRR